VAMPHVQSFCCVTLQHGLL